MAARVRRRRGALPWIERHGSGFRGWWIAPSGARHRGPTRATAEEAYDDAARARKRPPRSGQALTIGGACDVLDADVEKRERAAGTVTWYRNQRRILLRYYRAEAPLESLTAAELQSWLDVRSRQLYRGRPINPNTLRHHLRYLRRLFRVAVRHGWSGEVPLAKIVLPPERPYRPDVFGWEEALDLLDRVRRAADPAVAETAQHDADLLELVLRTGLRRSEVARLRLDDLDLAAKQLHVRGKTRPRTVPLSDQAMECTQRALRAGATGVKRKPPAGEVAKFTPDYISRVFSRWRRRLGDTRLHPHALRHTFGTELVRRGVPIATVARLLGHAPGSFAITMRYYSPAEPALRAAVDLLP